MKKVAVGIISAIMITAMLCACGANVEVDPMVTDMPDATNNQTGQSNGLAQTDGMQ